MSLSLRLAELEDAATIWRAVNECPQLDSNSFYCYWLICREFGSTCAVAEEDGQLMGFVTGLRSPTRAQTLFVWQLYVIESARGHGLAGRLLDRLLAEQRPRFVEATVAPDNLASLGVFRALARRHDGSFSAEHCLAAADFPVAAGTHEPELLITVSF